METFKYLGLILSMDYLRKLIVSTIDYMTTVLLIGTFIELIHTYNITGGINGRGSGIEFLVAGHNFVVMRPFIEIWCMLVICFQSCVLAELTNLPFFL